MTATSIEQSKKLLELGLDPNTADMSWEKEETCDESKCPIIKEGYRLIPGLHPCIKMKSFSFKKGLIQPCWSLEGLLKLLPDYLNVEGKWTHKWKLEGGYYDYSIYYELDNSDWYLSAKGTHLLDTVFNMVVLLLESKFI